MEFGFYMNHHEKNVLPEPEFVSVFSTRPPKKHPVQSEKFTCDLCADKFKHKTTITRHISKHLKGNFFRCIDCYKHYWNEKSYIRHRFEHSDPTSPSVKCAACPKYYSDIHGLETHQTRCHTKTGSFTCKVNKCGFSTKTYNALYMHKMTHRLFSLNCPRCNQEFMSKTQLNMHRKIHSSEKNIFECTICGKGFSSHSLQITHLKENHASLELFECEECQKLFANVDSFVLHQNMHKINREVSCGKCFKSFKTKFLKSHKCLTKVVTKTFTYLISENANQPTRIISDTFK